ncbi:hypothetical protein M2163_006901 [Streptomyces sp. SAI-135]|nr:hypothetical protein [Streptomyces sp. SAI-135]
MAAVQGGAEDGDHRAGVGVEHGSPGGPSAQPQGVPARGADRQLQGVVQEMEAVGGRVRDGGGTEHAGLAPAAGGQPHIGAGPDGVTHGDGQRVHAEPLGPHERQVQLGQRGHRVGAHHTAAVTGAQDQPGQPVDGLVTGDEGAVVVPDEAGPPQSSRQIVDPHEFRVPHGPGRELLPGFAAAIPRGLISLATATPPVPLTPRQRLPVLRGGRPAAPPGPRTCPAPLRPGHLPRTCDVPPRALRAGDGRHGSVDGVTPCRHGRTSPPYARSCARR